MVVFQSEINLNTTHETDILDITPNLNKVLSQSKIKNGILSVFVAGSTGAIISLEHEPGLLKDIPEFLERIIPKSKHYHHEKTWHDRNGHSHVRASLLSPSLTIPVNKGDLVHGTWQQIAFIELDDKPRNRRLFVTIIGD